MKWTLWVKHNLIASSKNKERSGGNKIDRYTSDKGSIVLHDSICIIKHSHQCERHDGIVIKAAQHRKRWNSSPLLLLFLDFHLSSRESGSYVCLYSFARRLVLSKGEKKNRVRHPPSDGYDEILGMGWNDSHMLPHYTLSHNNQKKWMANISIAVYCIYCRKCGSISIAKQKGK